MANLSVEAEKMNFESVWVAEGAGSDAFEASAVIALNTSKIGIGTDIVSIYTRHPCVLSFGCRVVGRDFQRKIQTGFRSEPFINCTEAARIEVFKAGQENGRNHSVAEKNTCGKGTRKL